MQTTFTLRCAGKDLSGTVKFHALSGDKQVWITLTDPSDGKATQILFHCNDRFDGYDTYYSMDTASLIRLALDRLESLWVQFPAACCE